MNSIAYSAAERITLCGESISDARCRKSRWSWSPPRPVAFLYPAGHADKRKGPLSVSPTLRQPAVWSVETTASEAELHAELKQFLRHSSNTIPIVRVVVDDDFGLVLEVIGDTANEPLCFATFCRRGIVKMIVAAD